MPEGTCHRSTMKKKTCKDTSYRHERVESNFIVEKKSNYCLMIRKGMLSNNLADYYC